MPVEAEILAARLTRIKTLIDAIECTCRERACLENQATRDAFLNLKQELEAARISVRPVRPGGR
jgi:hypothetical protein